MLRATTQAGGLQSSPSPVRRPAARQRLRVRAIATPSTGSILHGAGSSTTVLEKTAVLSTSLAKPIPELLRKGGGSLEAAGAEQPPQQQHEQQQQQQQQQQPSDALNADSVHQGSQLEFSHLEASQALQQLGALDTASRNQSPWRQKQQDTANTVDSANAPAAAAAAAAAAALKAAGLAAADHAAAEHAPPEPADANQPLPAAHVGTLWGLAIMTLGYLHLSTTLYTLPSLLPTITEELGLSDTQGGLVTTGYTILYGLAMVPVGLLADSANRPRLLAAGIALWSLLTMATAQTQNFAQLMATRVGFAVAQATQNPVSYSLIPELFPKHRTAAMAVYNSSIYLGRALAFVVVILAGQEAAQGGDVSSAAAALTDEASWRSLLWWLAPPGLAIAALALWTVDEPRQRSKTSGQFLPLVTLASTDSMDSMDGDDRSSSSVAANAAAASAIAAAALAGKPADAAAAASVPRPAMVSLDESAAPSSLADRVEGLKGLLRNPAFLALTGATAVNDVASWALIGWQATFYHRVMELEPSVYAPALAVCIPVGGILGGVGAAVYGDRLTKRGARGWLTAGTSVVAAPLVAASFLVDDYRLSFATLLVGYALSECWRSPAAVMVREVSPAGLGATASAVNLCVRCVLGSMGPIGVAYLTGEYGLKMAMLLIPACHLVAGLGLAATEEVIKEQEAREKEAKLLARRGHLG